MSIFKDSSGNYGLRGVLEHIANALFGSDSGSFKDTGLYKYFSSIFAGGLNSWNSLTGSGLTDSQREGLYLEDEIADENAEVAYQRTRQLNEDYGPAWQIEQTAKGYDAVGLNRMLIAGNNPGASATTASPQSSGGNLTGLPSSNLFETLLNFGLQSKKLDIEEGHLQNETKKTDAEVEGIDIKNANLQELLDLQKGELNKKIEFMGQQIETEPVKRALLRTEIGLKQAETAVKENMSALQKIDLKYHDAYQAAQLGIAQAYAGIAATDNKFHRKLLEQQIGINAKQIEIMNQTIITGKLEAGLLAKQFHYYDSDRKFNRWTTGIGTAAKVVGAVAGIAMGGAAIGKLKPLKTVLHNGNPVTDFYGAYEGLPGI